MKDHYIQRGYPADLVECGRQKALKQNRDTLLTPPQVNSSQDKPKNIAPLVLTHHPCNYQVRKIIMDNWDLLKFSELCTKALPDKPLFATRRATNLKDTLIRSRLSPDFDHTTNIKNCKKRNCDLCAQLTTTPRSVTCTSTGKTHKVTNVQCTTENVVYLLTCSVCKIQYIGETKNSFRHRYGDHKGYIRRKEKQPTAIHMNRHNDPEGHYKANILEVIHKDPKLPDTTAFRKKREVFWIYRFKTLIPSGLNKLT